MQYAPHAQHPARSFNGLIFVALLHVGLVAALMQGLHVPLPPIIDVGPVAPPKVDPKVEPVDPPPKDIKDFRPEDPTFSGPLPPPPLDRDDYPLPPPVETGIVDPHGPVIDPTGPIDKGPVGKGPVEDHSVAGPTDASVACSNLSEVRDLLADKLPLVADREGFADKGISRFDVNMLFTLGANGEIRAPQMGVTSNAMAARAMQPSILAGMRRLKCAGVGHEQAVQLPLSFNLVD